MNAKNIMDALNGIDETLFDVSEEHVKKGVDGGSRSFCSGHLCGRHPFAGINAPRL